MSRVLRSKEKRTAVALYTMIASKQPKDLPLQVDNVIKILFSFCPPVHDVDIQWFVCYSILVYFKHNYKRDNLSNLLDDELIILVKEQIKECKAHFPLQKPSDIFKKGLANRLAYVVSKLIYKRCIIRFNYVYIYVYIDQVSNLLATREDRSRCSSRLQRPYTPIL